MFAIVSSGALCATASDSVENEECTLSEKPPKMPWLESLYDMLAETKHAEIIGWDNSGTEIVFHAEKLPSVLENFFRSKELESFEKQLRNYEFKLHQKGTADRPTKYKHPLCTRDGRAFAIEHVTSKSESRAGWGSCQGRMGLG